MKPIDRSEILGLGEYEAIRPQFRARVIEVKKARRVEVGPHIGAVFENRDSVLMQIQEMLRTERITSEPGIQHEIDTYNELLPGPGQLSLTLMVQIGDRELRERTLALLVGLEQAVRLEADGERLPFRPSGERATGEGYEDRTTAVHYLRLDVPQAHRARIAAGSANVALVVDHPRYQARAALSAATLSSLADDWS